MNYVSLGFRALGFGVEGSCDIRVQFPGLGFGLSGLVPLGFASGSNDSRWDTDAGSRNCSISRMEDRFACSSRFLFVDCWGRPGFAERAFGLEVVEVSMSVCREHEEPEARTSYGLIDPSLMAFFFCRARTVQMLFTPYCPEPGLIWDAL